jgi:hypothetical protein
VPNLPRRRVYGHRTLETQSHLVTSYPDDFLVTFSQRFFQRHELTHTQRRPHPHRSQIQEKKPHNSTTTSSSFALWLFLWVPGETSYCCHQQLVVLEGRSLRLSGSIRVADCGIIPDILLCVATQNTEIQYSV